MAKRPSTTDVARLAGVSQTTVSFVLNNRMDIAIPDVTRQRVLEAARNLGYRRNSLARSLVRGCTQTIGVIVPRMDNSFAAQIVQGIQEACAESEYRVLLAHTLHKPEVEAHQVELLLEYRVDGLICVCDEWTITDLPKWLDVVLADGLACVLVDDRSLASRVDCIVSDDLRGSLLAVRHLMELGHRRIGHLAAGTRTSTARDRTAGYRQALETAGLPVDERLIIGQSYRMDNTRDTMHALLDLEEPPTAVFAANDIKAADAVHAIEERGLRIPHDVALVGYANLLLAHYLHLTSMDQHAQELGHRAARRVLQRIDDPDMQAEEIRMPTELVVRHSCGATLRTTG